jgi:hypothetical protein
MSIQLEALKNSIREFLSEIEKEEDDKLKKEITVTGDVAGYDTPRAFSNKGTHEPGYTKRMAGLTGYSAVNENRFQKLRLDQTMTPNQKIGLGVREIRRKIDEIEKFLEWYGKIKKENSLKGENFWKRTNHHIYRIKERLSNIGKNVTTLRK